MDMYNGVAGGIQRWSAKVRSPLFRAMRPGDLPVASRLRFIWHLETWVPPLPRTFLKPVHAAWVGLESSPYMMYCSFLETYTRQLDHTNPLVSASARDGLLQAKPQFYPSMPCLANDGPHECLSRAHDHRCFIIVCHLVHMEIHVPHELPHVPVVHNRIACVFTSSKRMMSNP